MVGSTNNTIDRGKAEVRSITGDSLIDILFIDNKGIVADKQLLTAILTGRPI